MGADLRADLAAEDAERSLHMPGGRVDYRDFAAAYMEVQRAGGNRIDLCRKLNITYYAASARIAKLAELGVELPPLTSSRSVSAMQIAELKQTVAPSRSLKKPPMV